MWKAVAGTANRGEDPAGGASLIRGPLLTAATVCGLWVLSDIGFYLLLPSLG
jgi:hypothetical protein